MLPSTCCPGRTFLASVSLLRFSRLVCSSVHFVYHPHSKKQTCTKKMYLSGPQKKWIFEMWMCKGNKNNYTNLKGLWNAEKIHIRMSKVLDSHVFELSVPALLRLLSIHGVLCTLINLMLQHAKTVHEDCTHSNDWKHLFHLFIIIIKIITNFV